MVKVHKFALILKELFGASLEDGPALLDPNAHDRDFLDATECRVGTDYLAAILGQIIFRRAFGILF